MEKEQRTNRVPPMHQGKWTQEEEEYVEVLVSAFKAGVVPIPDGTTLRVFLSSMLNCPAKRISKKFVGTNYNGKRAYVRKRESEVDPKVAKALHKKLREVERRFIKSLAPLIEFHEQSKKDQMKIEKAAATSDQSRGVNESIPSLHLQAQLQSQLPSEKLKPATAMPATQPAPTGTLSEVLNASSIRRLQDELRSMTEKLAAGPRMPPASLPTNTQPTTSTTTNDLILALLGQRVQSSSLPPQSLDVASSPSSSSLLTSLQQKFGALPSSGK